MTLRLKWQRLSEEFGLLSHQEAPVRLETLWAEGSAPPNPGSTRAVLAGQVNEQRGSETSVLPNRCSKLTRWLEPSRWCPNGDRERQRLGDTGKALPAQGRGGSATAAVGTVT
jgi:hypothetical protein